MAAAAKKNLPRTIDTCEKKEFCTDCVFYGFTHLYRAKTVYNDEELALQIYWRIVAYRKKFSEEFEKLITSSFGNMGDNVDMLFQVPYNIFLEYHCKYGDTQQ
jgi:hypothetical protein